MIFNNKMNQLPLVLFLSLLLAGCSQTSQPVANSGSPSPAAANEPKRIASADVVKAVPPPSFTIPVGGTTEAIVQLTIQEGYHVNANPPTFPYLKPTVLEVPAAGGISLANVTYPKALERKFAFAEQPLAVYEGKADLKVTLKADKTAKPGEQSIPAQLRIQACDEQVCYPPGTLEFAIPVQVK